jgi:hypothetical protein
VWPFASKRWLLGALACWLWLCAPARADRASLLFLGSEFRLRPSESLVQAPRYELALPHGLASADGRSVFVARVGAVMPDRHGSLAFPITMGMRWMPLDFWLRPLAGADAGGYLVQARGPRSSESPKGPEWCWSLRALAGAGITVTHAITMLLYIDGMWAQTPQDERARSLVYSSLGAGVELRMSFVSPKNRLLDMLLHGNAAPEGY